MRKQITIIAGHDSNEAREARTQDWLQKHGVTIEAYGSLQVLTMRAEINKGQYQSEYYIEFTTSDGEQEQSFLVVDLEPNPYDTRVYVEYSGDYGCFCKGTGCNKCNDELAAIERGENPWQHHTRHVQAVA